MVIHIVQDLSPLNYVTGQCSVLITIRELLTKHFATSSTSYQYAETKMMLLNIGQFSVYQQELASSFST